MYAFLNSRLGNWLFLLVFASLFAACGFGFVGVLALKTGFDPAYAGGAAAALTFVISLYLMTRAVARISKRSGLFFVGSLGRCGNFSGHVSLDTMTNR